MNGIEKIIGLIQSEGQAEIDTVLEKARADAAEITARYQDQSEAEAADLEFKNQKNAAEHEERLISVAQMESRKVVLQVKQEMIEKAYALALKKLCSMQEDEYIEVLKHLILKASVSGREEVIFSPRIREAIGKIAVEQVNQATGKNLVLSEETRLIPGGFILKDGNIEVNCAFDTLVRLERTETAGMVAKKLFG